MHIINQPLLYSYFSSYCYLRHTKDLGEIENNNGTLLQLMITVPLDDPIIYDLPIKVIKIDEFLSNYYLVIFIYFKPSKMAIYTKRHMSRTKNPNK